MTTKTISAENLGPISSLEFALKEPGVTVLVAPNGSGKTILLEAVQAAARGEGKLPLRDRTKRGKVEAFGATITIGGTCRHTGGFEVMNLEGRFDLAALVDPRIKSPPLADNARIKSLVSLTGVTASAAKFREHEALAESFDTVVKASSTETEDLVEMARKIKSDYDEAARSREDAAERETGHATALVAPSDLDLDEESDPKILQAAYDEARDLLTRLNTQAESAEKGKAARDQATAMLEGLSLDELSNDLKECKFAVEQADECVRQNNASITELTKQIEELKVRNRELHSESVTATARIATITRQLEIVNEAKAVLESGYPAPPSPAAIAEAKEVVRIASECVERGTLIRQALKDQEKASAHRKAATAARALALKYRDAGKATDEVLSGCIKCAQLRVESDGKSARLVTDTDRGKSIPYHDLSDGEKWTLAIDIGADQVGEGGLLVISQIGWEGIDGANRQAIHHHAKQRGVYILTAEASSDPEADHTIVPTRLPDVDPPVKKAYTPSPVEGTTEKATSAATGKAERAKRGDKGNPESPSPPAKPKPAPAPEEESFGDDEIPF